MNKRVYNHLPVILLTNCQRLPEIYRVLLSVSFMSLLTSSVRRSVISAILLSPWISETELLHASLVFYVTYHTDKRYSVLEK